jgi:hypothetical protein
MNGSQPAELEIYSIERIKGTGYEVTGKASSNAKHIMKSF